jgi:hypothetical protein
MSLMLAAQLVICSIGHFQVKKHAIHNTPLTEEPKCSAVAILPSHSFSGNAFGSLKIVRSTYIHSCRLVKARDPFRA